MSQQELFTLGIDIGSTTVKIAILDDQNDVVFSDYERHFCQHPGDPLRPARQGHLQAWLHPCVAGHHRIRRPDAGQAPGRSFCPGSSRRVHCPAGTTPPRRTWPSKLGGEDAKIIYFEGRPHRAGAMNGVCAGGTGSFIDQMASLLQTDAAGLNEYAKNYKALYSIAARCGVFAKSDIQPLINEGASKEDLAASIFQAVVNQTISGLACGKPIRGTCGLPGRPLTLPLRIAGGFRAHSEAG